MTCRLKTHPTPGLPAFVRLYDRKTASTAVLHWSRNGRFREGFRMPARRERSTQYRGRRRKGFRRERSTQYRGRRRKASEERTRGKVVSAWPSMGIWPGSGVGGECFSEDR